jgi:hypothetical protein
VIAFADKVYDSPMALSDLNIFISQARQLSSPQTTADQDGYHGDVSEVAKILAVRFLKKHLGLFAVEPVT